MAFELQPHLKGELLELRPLDTDDWNELFAVASDSLIWEQHPEPDRYTENVFRTYFQGALESGGAFAIIERESQQIIGSTRFYGYDPEKSEIEIGWTFLARKYWGGRYNAEMKKLLLNHADPSTFECRHDRRDPLPSSTQRVRRSHHPASHVFEERRSRW